MSLKMKVICHFKQILSQYDQNSALEHFYDLEYLEYFKHIATFIRERCWTPFKRNVTMISEFFVLIVLSADKNNIIATLLGAKNYAKI